MRFPRILGPAIALFVVVSASLARSTPADDPLSSTFVNWRQHPAIAYATTPTADPIANVSRRLETGELELKKDGASGYLRSLLDALNVPIASQIAVFAKDSVQAGRINVHNPRTLFFNDSVVVGWVRGGFIELAAQDPQQGTVFYTGDLTIMGSPRLLRSDTCLTCHHSYNTVGVPGMLVKSAGHSTVDHRLALDERWGGWYVTGQSGALRHRGNLALEQLFDSPPGTSTVNWPSFGDKFDASGYLSPTSDIVALMIFDHQMHMMNLLTRIGWEARVSTYQDDSRGSPSSVSADRQTVVSMDEAASELVDYLLFVDEARIGERIRGSTDFADRFVAQGPRDHKGRSLRDLDLERRLLKYPCSYMIYSVQFTALPTLAKEAVYRRMWAILSGAEKASRYRRLSLADRRAVVEILRETKKDLPAFFQPPLR